MYKMENRTINKTKYKGYTILHKENGCYLVMETFSVIWHKSIDNAKKEIDLMVEIK